MTGAVGTSSRLLASLARVNADHPNERKRLLGVDVNHGRELLLTLARTRGGWIGWEATTLRSIADSLAFVPLAARGLRVATDVEISALVAQAFHVARSRGRISAQFSGMLRHRGFRSALQDSILELRMAGVSPAQLEAASIAGSPSAHLVPVLAAYERVLQDAHIVDPAGLFQLALDSYQEEAPFQLDGVTALVPTLPTRGLTGTLVRRLVESGAIVLEVDRHIASAGINSETPPASALLAAQDDQFARSVLGWSLATDTPSPDDSRFDATLTDVSLFAAATPADELREVCRRAMAEGLRWDDVEIVATEPDTYGVALDALCQHLGIASTMLKGIPLERTRIGRALERWFTWLENGLPADVLRQALEAGEIVVRDVTVEAHVIGHALRGYRVGWGRARYESLLGRLSEPHDEQAPFADDDVVPSEYVVQREMKMRSHRALAAVLECVLAATPEVPERGGHAEVHTTAGVLASSTLRYLALLPVHDGAEHQTMDRLRHRLQRLAALEEAPTEFAIALAGLRDALADLRAWPPAGNARKPYRADGGLLHLTDLLHAGASGRSRTFVVGLDAERTNGRARQDPIIPDVVRRSVGRDLLPEVGDRRAAWLEGLGIALGSLRGRVTLSWSTRGAIDGRDAGPSPLLLQVFRIQSHDASRTFEDLRRSAMPPACAVPRQAESVRAVVLDARDVWLEAIAGAPAFLDAEAAVQSAFPLLAEGLAARNQSQGTIVSAFHGLVPSAGAILDPTRPGAARMSPSRLEALGRCPLHWFYRYGLGLQPPQDPMFDPEAWLDVMQRGSLLHEIFETFVNRFVHSQHVIVGDEAATTLASITESVIARWREVEPPPSESVYDAEVRELRAAVRAFLQMEREALEGGDIARWTATEYEFGVAGKTVYELTDGRTVQLHGRVDRIDICADGTLSIVDYKTGKPSKYRPDPKKGTLNGGRLLQPALYAAAVETAMRRTVSRFAYHFPTDRGGNAIVRYEGDALTDARAIVSDLVDHIRGGRFLPTTDVDDCRYCDQAPICRVRSTGFSTESPRADWARQHAPTNPEYQSMLLRRGTDAVDET